MTETQRLHAHTLIALLHPAPHATALIEITSMPSKRRAFKSYFVDAGIAAEHVVEQTAAGFAVYVSLNPRSQMSAFERDVPFVTTIGLDLQPERTAIAEVEKRLAIGGIQPTALAVSGGGVHMYFCLSEGAETYKAKRVWERLCKYTGSDAVFNVNRIFRVPGSLNWKTNPPRWCFLTGVWAERRYTVDQIDAALDKLGAASVHVQREGIQVPVEPPIDWWELRKRLDPGTLDIIDTGEKNAYSEKQLTRSEADWVVVCALVRAGVSDEMIAWVYETQPVGIMKYRESGARYLNKTIESARRATAEPLEYASARGSDVHRIPNGSAGDRYGKRRYW